MESPVRGELAVPKARVSRLPREHTPALIKGDVAARWLDNQACSGPGMLGCRAISARISGLWPQESRIARFLAGWDPSSNREG